MPDAQLDLDSLRKITPEHIDSRLARRQADMIWRVNFRHRPGSVVLLLEFSPESTPPWPPACSAT